MNNRIFKIDIDEILRSKAGSKAKFVPGFVRNWLKGIAHQDEINEFLTDVGDMQGVPWLDAVMKFLDVSLEVSGTENLPDDADGRRFTFVSNHPLGGPDGIAIGQILGHRYDGRIRYLVNDLLMNLHGLAPLCVPINKTGKQSRDFPRLVEAAFGSDNHIIMFPADFAHDGKRGWYTICRGTKPSLPRASKRNAMWCQFILTDATPTAFTVGLPSGNDSDSSSTSPCCFWLTKHSNTDTKHFR